MGRFSNVILAVAGAALIAFGITSQTGTFARMSTFHMPTAGSGESTAPPPANTAPATAPKQASTAPGAESAHGPVTKANKTKIKVEGKHDDDDEEGDDD